MADENLPNEFDIIVIGTGLSESILSGALSRIGKKVLHLDHNKYYGSSWSSFNLKAFEAFINKDAKYTIEKRLHEEALQKLTDDESFIPIESVRKTAEQGGTSSFLCKKEKEENAEKKESKFEDKASQPEDVINYSADVENKTTDHIDGNVTEDQTESTPIQEDEESIVSSWPLYLSKKQKDDNIETKEGEDMTEESSNSTEILKNETEMKKPDDLYTEESFYSSWRHFNLDLAPKLMFSRGKLVELLITSNVCRYLEFRNVTRTLTLLNDGDKTSQRLAPVPCSRTDVFTSKFVTMIEKRMLMRVLTMCANYENHPQEYKEHENGRFIDFLASRKLSKKLQHFILHSISMVTEDTNTLDGLKATQKFLKSLGRYGNSAFLWPLYGVGELPQAFCRLSAVFGGTFCLNRSLAGIIVSKESGQCVGIIDTEGQRLDCQHLILDECYVPESHRIPFSNIVSRAIYITDSSLLPTDTENVSLITIPPAENLPSSRLIEIGPSCCVCPRKHHVVHAMTSISSSEDEMLPSPQTQFCNIEKILFKEMKPIEPTEVTESSEEGVKVEVDNKTEEGPKPQVLWVSYFNMMSGGVNSSSLPSNVHITRGPSMDLGFDETILEAKQLFETICPEEEFLPRAPNPDEIVYFDHEDEGYNTESNGAGMHPAQEEDGGDYREDESELDAGNGEPDDDKEAESSDVQSSSQNEENTEQGRDAP